MASMIPLPINRSAASPVYGVTLVEGEGSGVGEGPVGMTQVLGSGAGGRAT